MADVEAARAALDRIEGILRRRYHYPHPIFEHVAAARSALEADPEVQVAPADTGANTETDPPTDTANSAAAEETPEPAQTRRKRGNR